MAAKKNRKTDSINPDDLVWRIVDWRELYELREQNRSDRPVQGGLAFRKSVVSPYDRAAQNYLMKMKRLRVHPERHLLKSVLEEICDYCCRYERERRGWLIDVNNKPLSLKLIALEIDLFSDQREPDGELLNKALNALKELDLVEQVPIGVWEKEYIRVKRRSRSGNRKKKDENEESKPAVNKEHSGSDPPDDGLTLTVNGPAMPDSRTGDSDRPGQEINQDQAAGQVRSPADAGTAGQDTPGWIQNKQRELQARAAAEAAEGRSSLPPATTPSQGSPGSHLSQEVDAGGVSEETSELPLLSLDKIRSLASLAYVKIGNKIQSDDPSVEFAWVIHEALGLGCRDSQRPLSDIESRQVIRNITSFESTYQFCLMWVDPTRIDDLIIRIIKRARSIGRNRGTYPNPAKAWTGIVRRNILPPYSKQSQKRTG
jgi:hypothetical protein